MMAARDIKKASDNLSCPVCYQLFKNPKYLPCHHSYCEQCLEKMEVQSKIICPECRKEAIVPPGGVKDLDNNFFINHLVDEFILKRKVEGEAEVNCDECHGEDPVVAFCPDCTLFLCHVCNEHHKRSINSRSHCIVPLTELRSKKDVTIQAKSKAMLCKEHDVELLFYCETCDQMVCMYCTVKDHNGHNHDTVKNMADKHKENLKIITAPIDEMIAGLADVHGNIHQMKNKIRQQGDEVNKKIDQHYAEVIQKLMEQKEQLKQQVHFTVSQKSKVLATQLEEVEHVQAEVLNMKKLNDAVEKSNGQEVLSVKNQVINHMQQITDKYKKVYVDLPPVQEIMMEFVPTKEAFPQFGLLRAAAIPDPYNCEIVNPPRYFVKGKKTEFIIITKDRNGDCCFRGGSHVRVQLGGVSNTIHVMGNNDGSYMASLVPQQVGEVKMSVLVNGHHIKESPYNVMVRDYTSISEPRKIVDSVNNENMGKPWGIAFGKNGMWAVADYFSHCVYLFDGEDQLVRKFGSKGSNGGQFSNPAGVAFDDDHLYVADHNNHRVQKFAIDGKYLLHFGGQGSKDRKLKHPAGLVVHNQKVYVADSDNHHISVFQIDGEFYQMIGSGQLGSPKAVAVNGNNQLLVVDSNHHCIYTFTLDGDYVGKFGTKGTGRKQLNCPYHVAVDLHGFILVSDTSNHRVSIFDKDGKYISCFGSEGSPIGRFQRPYGIAVNHNGSIYVSDHLNKRIQIFSC